MKKNNGACIEGIPPKWGVNRIKNFTQEMQRGAQPEYADGTNFFITNQACLSTYTFRPEKRKECEPTTGKKGKYRPGDILLASTGEGVLGKCVLADHHGVADTHVSILRLKSGCSPSFLNYILSVSYEELNSRYAKGSTKQTELQKEAFLSHVLALPNSDEQDRIAIWLDLQTRRIEQRIKLLDQKRELLVALKRSATEETTFRGLVQSAAMHESDIGWLGRVPTHWKIVRIGALFREASEAGRDGLPMLSVSIHSGISNKELTGDEIERKVSRSEDTSLYKRVQPGDLVYNQMRAWQGAFGTAKVEGLVSPAYVVSRPNRRVVPTFIEYLLRAPSAMEEIRRRSRGITEFRLRLYWDEFKNIRIALPPVEEQQAISGFLDRKLSQIDRQIALIGRLEALLQEQRKAIIHEAVTGKIDLSRYEPQQAATAA